MTTNIRAVLFDAVGTLLYPDPPVAEVYHAVGRRFGSRLTVEQIAARFAAAFAEAGHCSGKVDLGHQTNQETECRRWQIIVAAVFHELPNATGALFESLWDHFAQPRHWRLFDDAASVWRRLERDGFVVGIASNFDDRLACVCRGLSPLDHCERVFWSARIGHAKPSREFFACIQRDLNLAPSEILLVGDDYANDYLGATAAGWKAVLLDRDGKHQGESTNTIRSLAELPTLFTKKANDE